MKIANVVGTRPNFVKMGPLIAAQNEHPELRPYLIHTGQHRDALLSQRFFEELELPEPDSILCPAPAPPTVQFDSIRMGMRAEFLRRSPDLVLVVGDVTSTLAAATAAHEIGIPVAHVEAGLRCGDAAMLEEHNRIRTDALSTLLFASEPAAVTNLHREGIDPKHVHLVGNVMIDTLVRHREKAARLAYHRVLGLDENAYAIVTIHRRENLDSPLVAAELFAAIQGISQRVPVVLPAHPRSRPALEQSPAIKQAQRGGRLFLLQPLSYLEMLSLTMTARLVATDSGGIQEETSFLRVPCLTLRDSTERPLTVTDGTNHIAGRTEASILEALTRVLAAETRPASKVSRLWDGHAGKRIALRLLGHAESTLQAHLKP